jgi:hypothetical protein
MANTPAEKPANTQKKAAKALELKKIEITRYSGDSRFNVVSPVRSVIEVSPELAKKMIDAGHAVTTSKALGEYNEEEEEGEE